MVECCPLSTIKVSHETNACLFLDPGRGLWPARRRLCWGRTRDHAGIYALVRAVVVQRMLRQYWKVHHAGILQRVRRQRRGMLDVRHGSSLHERQVRVRGLQRLELQRLLRQRPMRLGQQRFGLRQRRHELHGVRPEPELHLGGVRIEPRLRRHQLRERLLLQERLHAGHQQRRVRQGWYRVLGVHGHAAMR